MNAPPAVEAPPLRVLVADDDPATRHFLVDALRALAADPQPCDDGTTALATARAEAFDLLLLDCRMPGAGAREVLEQLRADPDAASHACPVVATSAECDRDEALALLEAGFCDVLRKPCDLAALRQVLAMAHAHGNELPVLDDGAALASTGDAGVMHALRALLCEELLAIHRELERLAGEPADFGERLHRLRSSCGFCGAPALGRQIVQLQGLLGGGHPAPALAVTRFRQALVHTLKALGGEA